MKEKILTKAVVFFTVILSFLCLTSSVFSQDLGKVSQANMYAAKGQALYENGNYNEAVDSLKNAIEIRPEHARAHYYLALTYKSLGKKDDAVKLLNSYLVYIQQATEWLGSMDKEYIVKCKELLSQSKPPIVETAEESYNKGTQYYKKGDYDQAIAEFTKIIEIKPRLGGVYAVRGMAYFGKKDYENSWLDVHKAEALGYTVDSEFISDLKKASGRDK